MSGQEWYSKAVEHINPLRFHLHQMIEMTRSYNRFAEIIKQEKLPESTIVAAEDALAKAEAFFSPCAPSATRVTASTTATDSSG